MASYKRFKSLIGELVDVSEDICEARPISRLAEEAVPAGRGAEKGGLFEQLQRSFAAEVACLAELAIRSATTKLAAGLLEELLQPISARSWPVPLRLRWRERRA